MSNKRLLILFMVVALVQLFVPFSMILRSEKTLSGGTLYKFRTAPVDPYDAFRGKYVQLSFRNSNFSTDESFQRGDKAFVTLKVDSLGFALPENVFKTAPQKGDYLKVEVTESYHKMVQVAYPFDKYFMEEELAPQAEYSYNQNSRKAYVAVRVKKGNAVIEELYIDDLPIREFVEKDLLGIYFSMKDKPDSLFLESKEYERFQEALSKGADINRKGRWGKSLLHHGVYDNRPLFVAFLLEQGADPSVTNSSGESALLLALRFKKDEITKVLLEYGANANEKDSHGKPLFFYLLSSDDNLELVKLFIENQVDIDITDKNGDTALEYMAKKKHQSPHIKALIEKEKKQKGE